MIAAQGYSLDQPGAAPEGPRYTHEGDPDDRPVPGDSIQLIGDPVGVILEQAAQLPADYIVMGSHGHSVLYDCVVGSTAAGVVKRAECPVMLVPPEGKQADAGSRRILQRRGKNSRTEPARERVLATRGQIRRSPPGTDVRR